jgi:hypothetical protein
MRFVVEVLMGEVEDGATLEVEMVGVGHVSRSTAKTSLMREFLATVRIGKLVGWC